MKAMSRKRNSGDEETNTDGVSTQFCRLLAVMGCLIREMWPNATWMHQDNLEGVKIEICESVIVTFRTAALQ